MTIDDTKSTRRRFVGARSAGIAGPMALSAMAETFQQSDKPVTVGLVGAGIRGLELMQAALNAGGKVAAVCDLYDGHLRRAQEIQPNTPTTRDYREIINRKDIDARDCRHIRPLARRGGHRRHECRQGCVLRKADGSHDPGGARNGASLALNRTPGTGGQPKPQHGGYKEGQGVVGRGRDWHCVHGAVLHFPGERHRRVALPRAAGRESDRRSTGSASSAMLPSGRSMPSASSSSAIGGTTGRVSQATNTCTCSLASTI